MLDDTLLVDREHDVLDVIENDLQVLGALLARLVASARASSAMRRIDSTMPRRSWSIES